jgi:hypothetical protein
MGAVPGKHMGSKARLLGITQSLAILRRSQELKKYLKGENTEIKMEILKKRWEEEDARAIRPNPPEDLLCLTEFACELLKNIAKNYRNSLSISIFCKSKKLIKNL